MHRRVSCIELGENRRSRNSRARALVPPEQLRETFEVKPTQCRGCGAALQGDDPDPLRHPVAEIPPVRPDVDEHRLHWWHKYRDGEMAWSTFLGYARPIRWGVRQALGRGVSCASEKTAATCRMLLEGEEHLWTFLRVRGIEPTNNAAERALRHAVLWRKSSGGTASEWGSRFVERALSVAATCRQQGHKVLEYLTGCFRAHVTGGPIPSLLASNPGIDLL